MNTRTLLPKSGSICVSPKHLHHPLWSWCHPFLWLLWSCLLASGNHHWANFEVTKEWKTFSYNFLPHAPVQDDNFYNPLNILATGLVLHKERIFIATPKLFSGVPSTVNWIPRIDFDQSPVLQAYPDWTFATTGRNDYNCSDLVLVSVYRMRVDSCNRLWLLDAGISRSLEDYERTCPPKILVIDLNTDTVVRRIDFPKGILRGESLFTNLVIDETTSQSASCDDVFVYITDTVEPGIIVYDSGLDRTWRLSHPAMYPDPDFSRAEILTDSFVLMDGVVGMAFDDKIGLLYFQPFASDRVFSITRETLRAGPIAINKVLPVQLVGKKSSQGISLAVSPLDRSLIFNPVSEVAVVSWNPFNNEMHVLAQDAQLLQFISDMNCHDEEPGFIYVFSSKFHRFFLKNLNPGEVNLRIVKVPLVGVEKVHPLLPLKSFDLSDLDVYYQITNAVPEKIVANTRYAPTYFSQPNFTLKTPRKSSYKYEPLGITDYPFNVAKETEVNFPPKKRNRDLQGRQVYSWLDNLVVRHPRSRSATPITVSSPNNHRQSQRTALQRTTSYYFPQTTFK